MQKKNLRIVLTSMVAGAALIASLGLTACGEADQSAGTAGDTTADQPADDAGAAAPGQAAGFVETTIENADGDMLDGIEVLGANGKAFLEVAGVYFQPVAMSPGQENTEGFGLHLEADVAAAEDAASVGYEPGTWVPYMTVDYVISEPGTDNVVSEGSFMTMNASDGTHYGANIALDEGTYDLKFVFHNPAENGYLIHSDVETGPGGVLDDFFGAGPLELEFDGWEFVKQGW